MLDTKRSPLAGVNLNLFPVLDALIRHGSVTAAAMELGVTQSAVSHSLRELRAVLDDRLFVRTQRGMQPTPRTRALAPAVRAALESLGSAVHDTPTFDPAVSTRTFSLSTTDEISATLLPALVGRLGAVAPRVQLDIRSPLRGDETGPLFRDELDVLFRPKPETTAGLAMEPLYTDDFACLVRRDHPIVKSRLTLERYLALPHVLVAPRDTGPGPGVVDDALARKGLRRHIRVYTRYFVSAPEIVAQTDCVLTLPTRLARVAADRLPVRILAPPIGLEPFTVYRIWNATRSDEPALAWFNDVLADVVNCIS